MCSSASCKTRWRLSLPPTLPLRRISPPLNCPLRQEVKKLPSRGVTTAGQATSGPDPLQTAWQALTVPITTVRHSHAAQRSTPGVLEAVTQAFDKATQEYEQTKAVMASGKTDLDTLLERGIVFEKALG